MSKFFTSLSGCMYVYMYVCMTVWLHLYVCLCFCMCLCSVHLSFSVLSVEVDICFFFSHYPPYSSRQNLLLNLETRLAILAISWGILWPVPSQFWNYGYGPQKSAGFFHGCCLYSGPPVCQDGAVSWIPRDLLLEGGVGQWRWNLWMG